MTQTLEYMIDVMTRAKAGGQVQDRDVGATGDCWGDDDDPCWNWGVYDYRIKPREPRVIYVADFNLEPCVVPAHTDTATVDRSVYTIKFVEVLDDD